MVNKNQGKVYEPVTFYNRKILRNMLRSEAIKKNGFHKVSKIVHDGFNELKERR